MRPEPGQRTLFARSFVLVRALALLALLWAPTQVHAQDGDEDAGRDARIEFPAIPGASGQQVVVTFDNPTGEAVEDLFISMDVVPGWAAGASVAPRRVERLEAGQAVDVVVTFGIREDLGEAAADALRLSFDVGGDGAVLDTRTLSLVPVFTAVEEEPTEVAEPEPAPEADAPVLHLALVKPPPVTTNASVSLAFDPGQAGFEVRRVREFNGAVFEQRQSTGFSVLPATIVLGEPFRLVAEQRVQLAHDSSACRKKSGTQVAGWGEGNVALALSIEQDRWTRVSAEQVVENEIPCHGEGGGGTYPAYQAGADLSVSMSCTPREDGVTTTDAGSRRHAYRCRAEGGGEVTISGEEILHGEGGGIEFLLNGMAVYYQPSPQGTLPKAWTHPFEVVNAIGGDADAGPGEVVLTLQGMRGGDDGLAGLQREHTGTGGRQASVRESAGFLRFPDAITLGMPFAYTVSMRAERIVPDRYCIGEEVLDAPADTYVGLPGSARGQMAHLRYVAGQRLVFACRDSGRQLDQVHLSAEAEVNVRCESVGDDDGRYRYQCQWEDGAGGGGSFPRALEIPAGGDAEPALVLANGFGLTSGPGDTAQVVLHYARGDGAPAAPWRHPFALREPWQHPPEDEPVDAEVVADADPASALQGDGDDGQAGADEAAAAAAGEAPIDPESADVAALIDRWIGLAEPPENALHGDRLRYEPWGRLVGTTVDGGVITVNARPDDVGAQSSPRYLWQRRDRLDSVDHCTLGEYVEAQLAGRDIGDCRGRYQPLAPAVVGMDEAGASHRMAALGLAVAWRDGEPAPAPEQSGRVQRQSAEPGASLARGDTVTLWRYTAYRAPVEVAESSTASATDGDAAQAASASPAQGLVGAWRGAGVIVLEFEGERMELPYELEFQVTASGAVSGNAIADEERLPLTGFANGSSIQLQGGKVYRDEDGSETRIGGRLDGTLADGALAGSGKYEFPDPACLAAAIGSAIGGAVAPLTADEEEDEQPVQCDNVLLDGHWSAERP